MKKILFGLAGALIQRPYGDCIVTPQDAVHFGNYDSNRLSGALALAQSQKNPFASVLRYGDTPNISVETRAVVQEQAWMGHSLASPVFVNAEAICGTPGEVGEVGSTEFTERLGALRGRGPKVCVNVIRTDFAKSYAAAEDSMKKGLVELRAADIQATLSSRSGLKLVVRHDATFANMLNGDYNSIDTTWNTDTIGLPTSAVNWNLLKYATDVMKEEFMVDPFETIEGYEVVKVIGSQDIVERLRNEMDIREDVRAITAGAIKWGEKSLRGYSFKGPYRGVAFGTVPRPRRFNVLDASDQPVWIEPYVKVSTSRGVGRRSNPAYAAAQYEELQVIGADSFWYNTPTAFNGQPGFRFPRQLANNRLEFKVIEDNDCNLFSDYGLHIYEIKRSYRPERPHAVMSILFKRCQYAFGLLECEGEEPYYEGGDDL